MRVTLIQISGCHSRIRAELLAHPTSDKPWRNGCYPQPHARVEQAQLELARSRMVSPLKTPSRFGKYTVVDKLGAGGMAEVFQCRLSGIGGFEKPVVVKRILPQFAGDPEFVKMFLDEARIAAHLSHQNIIHVYEIDVAENLPYMAMEYVPGPTFSAILKRARQTQKQSIAHSVRIIRDICEGLHYAHNARDAQGEPLGIVHRDVSPQNVLVSMEGVAKLLDFGVAKSRGKLVQTQAGTLKGKLNYMAPEQLQRGRVIDHRADVFSLGVCLYQATTGKLPFQADNEGSLLMDLMQGSYAPPSEISQGYPIELERIVAWALQPDPDRRIPSAGALRDALDGFMALPNFHSGASAVAQWILQLFPPGDPANVSFSGVYGLTPSKHSVNRPPSASGARPPPPLPVAHGAMPPPPPVEEEQSSATVPRNGPPPLPPEPADLPSDVISVEVEHDSFVINTRVTRKQLIIGGSGLAAFVLTVGGYFLFRPSPRPAPAPAPVVEKLAPAPAPAAPAEDPDQTARAYVDEAKKLLVQHQEGLASDMLAKARDLHPHDSALNVELTTLFNQSERDAALQKARGFIATGQLERAAEFANAALSRDPGSAEAMALLQQARKKPAEKAAPRKDKDKDSRSSKSKSATDGTAEHGGGGELLPSDPDALLPSSQ